MIAEYKDADDDIVRWQSIDGTVKTAHINDLILAYESKRGKWISCQEKLPIPNERINHVWKYYLIQNEYTDMMVASYRENTKGERHWEQMYHNHPVKDKIVAWMELPEEYKEGNEE